MGKLNIIDKPWDSENRSYSVDHNEWALWLMNSNIENIHFPDFKRALTYSDARPGDEITAYLNNEPILSWTLGSDLNGVALRKWFNNQFSVWHSAIKKQQ